jgi:hypothetical protein
MMQKWLPAGALLISGIMGCSVGAHADLKYTSELKLPSNPDAPPFLTTTTYIRKEGRRVERLQQFGPMKRATVELTLCDKQQEYTIDPALKLYYATPLVTNTEDGNNGANGANAGGPGRPVPGRNTGKIITSSEVKDEGEETIADTKTHHYLVTTEMESSGCAGNGKTTTKMEVWMAEFGEPQSCALKNADPMKLAGAFRPMCDITYERRGNTADYDKVFSGLMMRMRIFNGDTPQPVAEQTVTNISRAKIEDDSLFTLPQDFEQVTQRVFQMRQMRAAMGNMMGGRPGGPEP